MAFSLISAQALPVGNLSPQLTSTSWILTSKKEDHVAWIGVPGGRWFGQCPKENVFFSQCHPFFRLPKSCVSIFNSKATKFTPGRVLDKNFDHKANKKINKDNLLSLCGCKCGQGFLVKGAKARKRKKTKNEAKKQPSSKSRPLGIFGRIKVKRKPRGLSIEKRHNKLPSTKVSKNIRYETLKIENGPKLSWLSSLLGACHPTWPRQATHSRSLDKSSKQKMLKGCGDVQPSSSELCLWKAVQGSMDSCGKEEIPAAGDVLLCRFLRGRRALVHQPAARLV